MKTATLKQAIDYVLADTNVQQHIANLEAQPNRFVIHHIAAEVRDIRASIVRVTINFYDIANPDNYKEDIVIDLQGTSYANFRIIKMSQVQL